MTTSISLSSSPTLKSESPVKMIPRATNVGCSEDDWSRISRAIRVLAQLTRFAMDKTQGYINDTFLAGRFRYHFQRHNTPTLLQVHALYRAVHLDAYFTLHPTGAGISAQVPVYCRDVELRCTTWIDLERYRYGYVSTMTDRSYIVIVRCCASSCVRVRLIFANILIVS